MIKRIFALMTACVLLFACAGCSGDSGSTAEHEQQVNPTAEETADKPSAEPEEDISYGNVLIVYFSNSGNAHALTEMITAEFAAETLRLISADHYEWENLFERAQDELNDGIRPELTGLPEADVIAQYDTILLGFPIWWYDLPMPVWTFLEAYDLSGKTIIPYFTHNGSSNGAASLDTIETLCPDSTVMSDDALSLWGDRVADSADEVKEWLSGLGLTK
ncbi:MAG: NAD(P)H-dependent oxidoreductase [Clostridia bacterium]|nr:NAD(P)H-dependent oxidoreductase [Clostridia bacterium]